MEMHSLLFIALIAFFIACDILFIRYVISHALAKYHSFFRKMPKFISDDNRETILKEEINNEIMDPTLFTQILMVILCTSIISVLIMFLVV